MTSHDSNALSSRCVLNALPKSQHGRAKADLQAIWVAATRAHAYAALGPTRVDLRDEINGGHTEDYLYR